MTRLRRAKRLLGVDQLEGPEGCFSSGDAAIVAISMKAKQITGRAVYVRGFNVLPLFEVFDPKSGDFLGYDTISHDQSDTDQLPKKFEVAAFIVHAHGVMEHVAINCSYSTEPDAAMRAWFLNQTSKSTLGATFEEDSGDFQNTSNEALERWCA